MQYFLRTTDADVGRYLRLFTLIPIPEIDKLLEEHTTRPHERQAQHRLAYEVMCLLHGRVEADRVLDSHNMLFSKPHSPANSPSKPLYAKSLEDINPVLNPNAPQTNALTNYPHQVTIPLSLVTQGSAARVFHAAGLVSSRSEGERLIQAGGAYVGRRMGSNPQLQESLNYVSIKAKGVGDLRPYVLDDSLLILRAGKWNVKIAKVLGDEEFEEQGLDVPGWAQYKQARDLSLQAGGHETSASEAQQGTGPEGKVLFKAGGSGG